MTSDDIDEFLKDMMIEIPNLYNYKFLSQQIVNLTKSLEIKQNIAQLKCRGKFNFIIGSCEQALADLTKLLEFKPNDSFALKYRGETYHMMNEYENSLVDLDKLLEININDNKWIYESYEQIIKKPDNNKVSNTFILKLFITKVYFYRSTLQSNTRI